MNHTEFANKILKRNRINVDITHRCPLECPKCQRFQNFKALGVKVTGEDLSDTNFEKVINHFSHVNFCGQLSDPVHHPRFIEFLEKCYWNRTRVTIHHASAGKSMSWYKKAFKANEWAKWWFGIDGLPHQSSTYRINQDGEKLYRVMLEAKKALVQKPTWQYIVFKYNEHSIEEAAEMAKEAGVRFMLVHTSRWDGPGDNLRPEAADKRIDR